MTEWRGKKDPQGPGEDNHHDLLRVVGVGSGHAMGEGAAVAPISLAFTDRNAILPPQTVQTCV